MKQINDAINTNDRRMKRFGKLESDGRDRHSVEWLEDNMEEPLGKWGKVGNGKETLEK